MVEAQAHEHLLQLVIYKRMERSLISAHSTLRVPLSIVSDQTGVMVQIILTTMRKEIIRLSGTFDRKNGVRQS
jgi:hypothetical protein